jgi:5-methylcytosine-specific restriction endonuclease McrA
MNRTKEEIDAMADAILETGGWNLETAKRAVIADFKCEYCDRDLLASVDDYKSFEDDHIVPLSLGGSEHGDNIAFACRTCNFHAKHKWDPRKGGENKSREELIRASRAHVSRRREQFLEKVLRLRKIMHEPAKGEYLTPKSPNRHKE